MPVTLAEYTCILWQNQTKKAAVSIQKPGALLFLPYLLYMFPLILFQHFFHLINLMFYIRGIVYRP